MLFECGALTGADFVKMEMGGKSEGLEQGERVDLMGERADTGCPQCSGPTLYLELQTERADKTQRAWF